jgi:hypothetical protein
MAQNDYISRDTLIKSLVDEFCEDCSKCGGHCRHDDLFAIIDKQPTAYDVEKVVEQTHEIFRNELHIMLKPLPDGTEYPEEAYRLLYLNDCVSGTIRNGGKE